MNQKTILILGASSSIGLPLCEHLLKQNYIIIAQHNKKNERLNNLKIKYKDNLLITNVDFNREIEIKYFLNFLQDEIQILDGIIHLLSPKLNIKPLAKTSWEEIILNLDVQFKSLFLTLQVTLKKILKSNFKRIIVVNSELITQKQIAKGYTAYATAKAAVNQYLNCLNAEYSSKDFYINQISPTMFKSSLLDNIPNYILESSQKISKISPEKDILPKILFLLSEEGLNYKGKNFLIN